MDFKPYYNDWLDVNVFFDSTKNLTLYNLPVNLNLDFFKSLRFDSTSLKKYRTNAALKTFAMLGEKPALCFSGGADSQAMLQCCIESGLQFDIFTLVFKNDLNAMDYTLAKNLCDKYNINLKEIEIDVIKFLNFYNYEYAIKYKSVSPHFNVHYKLFDILKDYGYTGVCCGGDIPYKNLYNNTWGSNFSKSQNNFVTYCLKSNFNVIGNFLSYTPELAWATALLTLPAFWPTQNLNNHFTHFIARSTLDFNLNKYDETQIELVTAETERYFYKCRGYKNAGMYVVEQAQKYTGFENVKLYLQEQTGDGWEFEKRYRHPIEKIFNFKLTDVKFNLKPECEELINLVQCELLNINQ